MGLQLLAAPSDPVVTNAAGRPFGAVGDDATDCSAALQAALDAAAASGGGVVFVPAGVYRFVTPLTIGNGVVVQGAGPKATVLKFVGAGGSGTMVSATGTLAAADATTVTVTTAINDTTLTVADSSTLVVGSTYRLGSNEAFSTVEDTDQYKGELVTVLSIDSPTQVTIAGRIRDVYSSAAAASLRLITPFEGVGVRDLSIVNGVPDTTSRQMLKLSRCRDFILENLELVLSDMAGISIANCWDWTIDGVTCRDFSNNTGAGRFGYGIELQAATENGTVSNCRFRRCRTGITTSSAAGQRGVVRDCVISNCVAREMKSNSFDTHAISHNITFVGCHASGGTNVGFNMRGRACHVTSGSVRQCAQGVTVGSDGHGTVVENMDIRRIWSSHGIQLSAAKRVTVQNNRIEGVRNAGIYIVGAANGARIIRNLIANTGLVAGAAQKSAIQIAAALTLSGLTIQDNTWINDVVVGGEPVLDGNMDYGFNNGSGTGLTASFITDNRGRGMATALINDASLCTRRDNFRTDQVRKRSLLVPTESWAETIPRNVGQGNLAALASGALQLTPIEIPAGSVVANLTACSGTTPLSGGSNQWFCLMDAALNILLKTVDDGATAWAADALKTLAVATDGAGAAVSSMVFPEDIELAFGVVVVASTPPTLRGNTINNAVAARAPRLSGRSTTGLTNPASLGAQAGALTSSGNNFYASVDA